MLSRRKPSLIPGRLSMLTTTNRLFILRRAIECCGAVCRGLRDFSAIQARKLRFCPKWPQSTKNRRLHAHFIQDDRFDWDFVLPHPSET